MTNRLASVAVDDSVLVAHTTNELREIAFDKTTNANVTIHDEATLVQLLALKSTIVDGLFIFLLDTNGFALLVAKFVKNATLFIYSKADETLWIGRGHFSDHVTILVFHHAALDDAKAHKPGELTLRACETLALGKRLAAPNLLATIIVDDTLFVTSAAFKFSWVAPNQLADWNTVRIYSKAFAVESESVKN
jgi:hypothetical protein